LFSAEVLLDSINSTGRRVTTFRLEYPRVINVELFSHRVFSRNTKSTREMPVKEVILRAVDDPYIPQPFGRNQADMPGYAIIPEDDQHIEEILRNKKERINYVVISCASDLVGRKATSHLREYFKDNDGELDEEYLSNLLDGYQHRLDYDSFSDTDINLHRQLINRDLEPYLWANTILTGDDFDNFFALRNDYEADPAIQVLAAKMQEAYNDSSPEKLAKGVWHLPLLTQEEKEDSVMMGPDSTYWAMVSAGRCDLQPKDITVDYKDPDEYHQRAEHIAHIGHLSPLEHPCQNLDNDKTVGNLRGWKQVRKFIKDEDNFALASQKIL